MKQYGKDSLSQVFETSDYQRWHSSYSVTAAINGYPIDEQRIEDLMFAETTVTSPQSTGRGFGRTMSLDDATGRAGGGHEWPAASRMETKL